VTTDYLGLLERILDAVDQRAYFVSSECAGGDDERALPELSTMLAQSGFDADGVRAYVRGEHEAGRIDNVVMLSALHVVACHPAVGAWEEAARLAGAQELAALQLGGPHMDDNLASVDRHRGVLAYLLGHVGIALDYFARAFERQRSAENLTNILAAMLRLGEESEARDLLVEVRSSFPPTAVSRIDAIIDMDPDLALLRTGDIA